jgi:hypothetical protein
VTAPADPVGAAWAASLPRLRPRRVGSVISTGSARLPSLAATEEK